MKIQLRLRPVAGLNQNDQAMLAVELEEALRDVIANDATQLPTLTEICKRNPDDLVKIEVEI